jgi:hypothetical protein
MIICVRSESPLSKCAVCQHPERQRIEALRASGAGLDALSRKFGVHRDAIWRHWTKHVSSDLKTQYLAGPGAIEALKVKAIEEGGSVLDYLSILRSILMGAITAQAEAGSASTLGLLSGRMVEVLREIARLTGEIGAMPSVTVNNTMVFNSSPQFVALTEGLLGLARRHPGVRSDIVALLRSLDAAPSPPIGKPNGALIEHQVSEPRHA